MGLFRKTRFMWNEPWFFLQRIRPMSVWLKFIGILLVVAALAALGLWLGRKPQLWELIVLPIGFAGAVWYLLDGTNARRSAVLDEKHLVVGGDMGQYSHPTTYQVNEIGRLAIVKPEKSKWPAAAVYFFYRGTEEVIGIDSRVSPERLAQALTDVGIEVELDGWLPNQLSEFEQVFHWQADSSSVNPTASISEISADEPGLYSGLGIAKAIVQQCWALTLWLLITLAIGYYAYLNWNTINSMQMILIIGLPIALMTVAGQYTERIAFAATSKTLVQGAKDQIYLRRNPLINPKADNLMPVEIFERNQFANAIQKIYEMGFVEVIPERNVIHFEGKKQQWIIPSESIRTIKIEEVQVGTAGQSALGALQYYVTLQFDCETGTREFGFRYADRDFGALNDMKRAKEAIGLFEEIAMVLDETS